MKDSKARLQIALIASNVLPMIGLNDESKKEKNVVKKFVALQDEISLALLIAEAMVKNANTFCVETETEDESND